MKSLLHFIFITLAIIGCLNWGLFGIADIDLVKMFFGGKNLWANVTYSLVGLSGLYLLFNTLKKI